MGEHEGIESLLIAIDYDETFTADPNGWRQFMSMMAQRGHKFICVTGRRQPPDFDREPRIPCPVVCAGDEYKYRAAIKAGHRVDIWIDDCPGMIEETRLLKFDDGEKP